MPRYITVKEAAEMLGACERTVRRRIKDGTLSAARIGRLVRLDAAQVELLLKGPADTPNQRLINEAPPLTDEQLQTIVTLLSGQLAAPSSK